jgi:hypothetical protein
MRSSLYMIAGSRTSSPKLAPTAVVYKPSAAYATFPHRYESGSAVDLLLVGPAAALKRYPVVKGQLKQPVTIAANVGPYTHVINAGDWNGGRVPGRAGPHSHGEDLSLARHAHGPAG